MALPDPPAGYPGVANVAAKRLPDFIAPQGRRLLRKKQVKFGVEMPKGERGNRVLRNLDKLVGVPILLLLGLMSQVRVRRRRPRRPPA